MKLAKAIVSLLGVGYIRPASATFGSAAAGLLLFFLWPQALLSVKLGLIIITLLIGTLLGDVIEKNQSLHDPHFFVLDEALGMMITTLFLGQEVLPWVVAFFLFRFFDIAKLWPASIFDKKTGGFSIMIDDAFMALPALGVLSLLIHLSIL